MEKLTDQQKLAILQKNYKRRYNELVVALDNKSEFEKSLFLLKRKDWKMCWGNVVKDEERDSFIKAFSHDKAKEIDKIASLEARLEVLDKRIAYMKAKIAE